MVIETATPSKGMNIALWIAQIVLAAMFGMTGVMKLISPIEELALKMTWAAEIPEMVTRTAGLAELLGAMGLILPSVVRVMPRLTVYAADGLIAVMLCAAVLHSFRGEIPEIGINIALAAVALFVAWGRKHKVPVQAR